MIKSVKNNSVETSRHDVSIEVWIQLGPVKMIELKSLRVLY